MPDNQEQADGSGPIARMVGSVFGSTAFHALALFTLASCALVVAMDVVMWFLVSGYNPVSQTISDLAAGQLAEILDFGLCIFAAGIVALTAGLTLRGEGTLLSYLVRLAMLALGGLITLIALHNEYGDGDGFKGFHLWLVAALGILVPFILWAGTCLDVSRDGKLSLTAKTLAVVWVLLAPFFMMVPDSIQGAYERVMAVIMVASVAAAGFELYRSDPPGD